jgi:hypothetical protein
MDAAGLLFPASGSAGGAEAGPSDGAEVPVRGVLVLGPGAGLFDLFLVLRRELDPSLRKFRGIDPDLDRLVGEVLRQVGKILADLGIAALGHDTVLEELVRGVVLDIREVPLPKGGDDIAVLGRLLGFSLDQLEELLDFLPVQALVKEKDLKAILEEEERQALDGQLVGEYGFSPVGEGIFLDPDLELLIGG